MGCSKCVFALASTVIVTACGGGGGGEISNVSPNRVLDAAQAAVLQSDARTVADGSTRVITGTDWMDVLRLRNHKMSDQS